MGNKLYESINIPSSCAIEQPIFKKMFYENYPMTNKDKDLFKNHVEKITWKYSLKEENIDLKPYETDNLYYEEIEVIEVLINDYKNYKKIAEIIQKTIPYPTILIFIKDNYILINTAYKKANKEDIEKNKVEAYLFTSWINTLYLSKNEEKFLNSINIKNLSFIDTYKFYCSFVDKLNILKASNIIGDFDVLKNKDINEINDFNLKAKVLAKELEKLKSSLKKEKQFNKKMELNIKLKKSERKFKNLIEKLKT